MEGIHHDGKVRGVNLGGWLVVEGWIKPSLFDDIPNGDMLVSLNFFHHFGAFFSPHIRDSTFRFFLAVQFA